MNWKKRICGLLIALGLFLIIGFFVTIAYKYFSDTWRVGTLPFHTIAVISGLELLLPGLIITTVALFVRSKC